MKPSMKHWALAWLGTALALCLLDYLWLAYLSPDIYQAALGPILLKEPRLVPAALFYLVYVTGLVIFCVAPGLAAGRVGVAARQGALFGFVAYATYDLTNWATLTLFSGHLVAIDLTWGTLLSAIGSAAGCKAALYGSNLRN